MKIIVTGGRDFKDEALVRRLLTMFDPEQLIVGDCPTGADAFAREWGKRHATGCAMKVYRADWNAARAAGNERSAGPIRNHRMIVENLDASFVLAFPGGRGTADCVDKAHAMTLLVLVAEP